MMDRHLRLLSTASAALLLIESRSLLSIVSARSRRTLVLQLRLAAALYCFRRVWTSLEESDLVQRWIEKVPMLKGFVQRVQAFFRRPEGALVAGSVLPGCLVASGLSLALAKTTGRQHAVRARQFRRALAWCSVPTLVAAVEEQFGEDVDVIAVLAFELGLLLGEHSAAGVILFMLTGGEALEHYAFHRARASLGHVLEAATPSAHRLREPFDEGMSLSDPAFEVAIEEVDVNDVKPGDVLAIRGGEAIPVDGCLCGMGKDRDVALVEESLLTGEAGGAAKRLHSSILSGSVAQNPLWLKVTAPYLGSTLELMRQALQDALERKSQIQHNSARAAFVLQPLTLIAAALALVLRWKSDPRQRWKASLAVLMAATPCPASIGVPVAFLSGMSVAAHQGVLIKSGAAIEAVSKATHIVLDKTGTLTRGSPTVLSFEVTEPNVDRHKALQLVASLEAMSVHPLALALRSYAVAEKVSVLRAEDAEYVAGCGMSGMVGGRFVVVGTLAFLKSKGVKLQQDDVECSSSRALETFFAFDGLYHGRATFEDVMLPGTSAAVQQLQALGLQVSILSGDRSRHVFDVAAQVGCANAEGGLLPHEKAQRVHDLVKFGAAGTQVIMVGDGGNDAPAIAAANVGIVVGTQSGLASQCADVVVGRDGCESPLSKVVSLVLLCRKVVATAKRGVNGGLGLSAVNVVLATLGLLSPRSTAILQEVVDLSALLNSASVLRHRQVLPEQRR
eukprot:TRINITY_DN46689_c0_g1_i1.p1 TRINITY_DN46689_c0_g1~~TRINITY_DN46689_c0_g1_i1.p1  ORF type:complete len:747 (-),score=126.73 TRINITY_DN46689_c0_g1_i1:345-2543(-)